MAQPGGAVGGAEGGAGGGAAGGAGGGESSPAGGGEMGEEITAAVARAKLSLQPGLQGRGGSQGRRGLQGGRGARGGDRGDEAEIVAEIAEDCGGPEPSLRRLRLQVCKRGMALETCPYPHSNPDPDPILNPSPSPNSNPSPEPDLNPNP